MPSSGDEAHEPLSGEEIARLKAMELPPCPREPLLCRGILSFDEDGNPVFCACIIAARVNPLINHDYDVVTWARMLLTWKPKRARNEEDYAERDLAEKPSRAVRREARIARLMKRRAAGKSLWHPDDLLDFPNQAIVFDELGNEILTPDIEEHRPCTGPRRSRRRKQSPPPES